MQNLLKQEKKNTTKPDKLENFNNILTQYQEKKTETSEKLVSRVNQNANHSIYIFIYIYIFIVIIVVIYI